MIDDIPFLPVETPCEIPNGISPAATALRLPLARALRIAEHIKHALEPFCAKIEIAGSIRRKLATCGDIDLVVEPRDWMGEAHQALRARIKAKTTLITAVAAQWLRTHHQEKHGESLSVTASESHVTKLEKPEDQL